MRPPGPSQTAIAAAVSRAIHLRDPARRVFEDELAMDLAGDDGRVHLKMLQELPPESMYSLGLVMALRARYVEEMVETSVAAGITQYVVLGAGLDSFAYRRGDLLDRLRVFEVDAPAMQSWKRDRLRALGVDIPDALDFVAVDFEKDQLIDALVRAGLNPMAPTVVSWIAVTQYLTRPAVDTTLDAISSLPHGSRVVLSYVQPPEVMDETTRRGFHWTANRTAEAGEPFLTLFEPDQIEHTLHVLGFSRVDHFSARDAERRYLADRPEANLPDIERLLTARI